VNPRGNLWANDESKFGQKLMEKMGWEKGTGLGAKQDGMVDHITLKHKDNNKGVGFQGHDDNWLAHQEDFQNVLAALNVQHGETGKKLNESEKKATLEEISKKSKRRVHYQKFVKGKDSSNYSAVDLGCILGTKSDKKKNESEPSSPCNELQETSLEENKNFVQSGNYTDYFAKKMAELKAKGKFTDVPAWTESKSCTETLGFGSDKPIITDDNIIGEIECKHTDETNAEQADSKKKKKSKKNKRKREDTDEFEVEDKHREKKKAKKAKKDKSVCNDITLETAQENNIEHTEKKKSKKLKSCSDDSVEVSCQVEEVKKKKAKKSKKAKELVDDIEEVAEVDSGCEQEDNKSKRTKKGKNEKVKDKKEEGRKMKKKEKEDRKMKKKQVSQEEEGNLNLQEGNEKKATKSASPEDDLSSNPKKIKFHGSNLLTITGYGIKVSQ